ncbi:ricin-type beta-trefoil lectin domain protein [Dactylosporangium sp. NPDC050688]|uniref:ricin-type beta-trefoil lectin domain protein n=1 Tax=Dactylosporangium sp. NPDC050688 TaxID=3157217 RepID=UPI0033FA6965
MHHRLRLISTAAAVTVLAATVAVAAASPAHAESNRGVRVMPLGASITDGFTTPGGYRTGLWQRFVRGGYAVDFVGSASNGPASLGDRDHEGHTGWRIDQIDARVADWLRATNPHAVLLHVGTNDVSQNHGLANAPGRLSGLIDKIQLHAPGVEIFVAQLVPSSNSANETRIRAFNAALPGVVAGKGPRVHLVDMHSVVSVSDLADGTHPTAAGYDKMAAAWYSALRSVPNSLRPAGPPTAKAVNLTNARSLRCLDVNRASTAAGAATIIWDCHGGANQRWSRTAAGELRVYGTSCLDVHSAGTANRTKVIIWPCHGGTNQKWTFNPNGSITAVGSGRCLDVAAGATANETPLQIYDCNGTGAQQWAVR